MEYELESKTSTGSMLPLYISLLLPSPNPPPYYYNISQPSYPTIIRQFQEQIAVLMIQVGGAAVERMAVSTEVTRPQVFDWDSIEGLRVCDSMQTIYKNEDERGSSRRTNLIGVVICAGRISRCLKGKYIGGFGSRSIRIWDCREIFDGYQERVQMRR